MWTDACHHGVGAKPAGRDNRDMEALNEFDGMYYLAKLREKSGLMPKDVGLEGQMLSMAAS